MEGIDHAIKDEKIWMNGMAHYLCDLPQS